VPTDAGPDLRPLVDSWLLELRAERSQGTQRTYLKNVHVYLGWCAEHGKSADLTRRQVQRYIGEMLERGWRRTPP
jgi:hypothetical protein